MLESLSTLESVGVGGFMMAIVFTILLGIYVSVRIFSWITMKIEGQMNSENSQTNN